MNPFPLLAAAGGLCLILAVFLVLRFALRAMDRRDAEIDRQRRMRRHIERGE